MQAIKHDRQSTAAYIATFLPELKRLAEAAGYDVLGYLLTLAEAEAKQLSNEPAQSEKTARRVSRN